MILSFLINLFLNLCLNDKFSKISDKITKNMDIPIIIPKSFFK